MTARVRQALGRVVLTYLGFGVVFVAGTEVVLASTDSDEARVGVRVLFLMLSTVLLIALVRRELVRRHEIEDRLMHAQQHESLARMAGGVAHDFNNLLTVILGYTDLVMRDLGPDHAATADLEAVRRSGEQARSLVDQLLTVSRHRVVQPVPVNPTETVSSLRDVIRRLMGDDVEVELLLLEVPEVLIDPGQLEQVVLTHVVNARDAMPGGGRLTLTASPGRLPDDRPSVDLTISDTGTGMDKETAARCFEPFFTTKDRTEGTGLGLATVAAIVERAGGRVGLDSEPGKGTTFLVQLPAVPEDAREVQVERPGGGGAEHVLIVEDDDKVRGFARRVLEQNGYATKDVSNGLEALSLLRAGDHPDLVVTDVLMPAMGGVELAAQMRDVVPDTPVLFVSGYAEDPRIHNMAGDVPFLAKPFSPPDLLRAVRHAIDAPPRPAQGSNR